MAQLNVDYFDLKLDPSIYRVIRLKENLSEKAGYDVTLNNEHGSDVMTISTGNGTKKIKCRVYVPPQTGQVNIAPAGGNFEACSLWPTRHRIVLLGTDISADEEYQLTLKDKGVGPGDHDHVLTMTSAGVAAEIPANGAKIPPNTGE